MSGAMAAINASAFRRVNLIYSNWNTCDMGGYRLHNICHSEYILA
jgi:hypothetical protein